MQSALPWFHVPSFSHCRELVLPKEHGSWSLAFEPLALGLIVAPSVGGSWLALAVAAAFFARRPLRIAWREIRPERRHDAFVALAMCGLVSAIALGLAFAVAGPSWAPWLLPSAVAGAWFLSCDLRNDGREETAEIAGATAFALLPAAFAVIAGASPAQAAALGLVMCGRAVPAVMCVRASLRAAKTGVRRPLPAVSAALVALVAGAILVRLDLAPVMALVAFAVLAVRTLGLLVFPRPAWRARTIGMIEATLGVAFVLTVAVAWHR